MTLPGAQVAAGDSALPKIPVSKIALRQLDLRRRHRPQGCDSKADHEARLRPWAALAIRAGADLAAVSPDAPANYEDYRAAGCSDTEARALIAADLCGQDSAKAELTRARNTALDLLAASGGGEAAPSTADLCILANWFGCPGYLPTQRTTAAAEQPQGRSAQVAVRRSLTEAAARSGTDAQRRSSSEDSAAEAVLKTGAPA